jgi:hypothetical protein
MRDHEQPSFRLDDRADVELRAPLPGAPRVGIGLLPRVDQQVGERTARRFDLMLLVPARLDEETRRRVGHEDLPGLPKRWT